MAALDSEMNDDMLVVRNYRVDLLRKSFKGSVRSFDGQSQIVQSLNYAMGTSIRDEVLGKVERNAVHSALIPNLSIDLQAEAPIELRFGDH
jgi:hypothetical protein